MNSDTRITFIPRGTKTRRDRIRNIVPLFPFSACCFALNDDKNVNLVYRSLANFGGKEMFIVGSQNWFRGATNGVEDVIPVHYFDTFSEFLKHVKEKTEYSLVSVEQSEKSIYTNQLNFYPENSCFVFGNETSGLGDDVLLNSDLVVEIPMRGVHPCANVGVSSGIMFFDYINKFRT